MLHIDVLKSPLNMVWKKTKPLSIFGQSMSIIRTDVIVLFTLQERVLG
jgi:hypothetical protein